MALELIYKAITVAKNREPDTNSHNLSKLSSDAGVEVTEMQNGLLDILSESIIWDGRYPVPKKQEYMQKLHDLHHKHLYDKVDVGKLQLHRHNGALDWNGFSNLWQDAVNAYWPLYQAEEGNF